jgi:hypothetical protein
MRITDDRYTRDRLRLDLALRLIRHEARTRTIRSWTGLTDDRIRKLYRSYVADGGPPRRAAAPRQEPAPERVLHAQSPASGARPRGSPPSSASSASSARGGRAPGAVEQLRFGETFCEAYETF